MADYSSVDDVYNRVPMIGSVTEILSAQILVQIDAAEAEINAALAKFYTVPVTHGPPLLKTIATEIACFKILGQRIFTEQELKDSVWTKAFQPSYDWLKSTRKNLVTLVDSAGNVIQAINTQAEVKSNTQGYHQTFWEGPRQQQIIDPDKIDDQEQDRNL